MFNSFPRSAMCKYRLGLYKEHFINIWTSGLYEKLIINMVMGGLEWPDLPSREGFHTFKTRVIKHHNCLMVFGYPEQTTPLASTGDRRLYPLHKAILFQLHGTYCTTCMQCKLKSFKISYENQSFKLPDREKEWWSIGCRHSHGNVPYCTLSQQEKKVTPWDILYLTGPHTVHTGGALCLLLGL